MRIRKVKLNNEGRTLITYEKQNSAGEWDEYSLSCKDSPRPEFKKSLEALIPHVLTLTELPKEYEPRIKVNGVSVSFAGDDDVMGATIIATLELKESNADLNLNTPHKAERHYHGGPDGDPKQLLPLGCPAALERLFQECEKYIDGERAQQNLFKGTK